MEPRTFNHTLLLCEDAAVDAVSHTLVGVLAGPLVVDEVPVDLDNCVAYVRFDYEGEGTVDLDVRLTGPAGDVDRLGRREAFLPRRGTAFALFLVCDGLTIHVAGDHVLTLRIDAKEVAQLRLRVRSDTRPRP